MLNKEGKIQAVVICYKQENRMFYANRKEEAGKAASRLFLDDAVDDERKIQAMQRHCQDIPLSTWIVLAKHKSLGSKKAYKNAELIFNQPEISSRFSDDMIFDIASSNRALCQVMMNSNEVQGREALHTRLNAALASLGRAERRGPPHQ